MALRGNALGGAGGAAFAAMLAENTYITHADLAANGLASAGAAAFAAMLRVRGGARARARARPLLTEGGRAGGVWQADPPSDVRDLDLSDNDFLDMDATALCAALAGNRTLVALHLADNHFGGCPGGSAGEGVLLSLRGRCCGCHRRGHFRTALG